MMRGPALFLFLLAVLIPLPAQEEALRGELSIDLEPIFGFQSGSGVDSNTTITIDEKYPPVPEEARRRALDEAARLFGGMIYGWSFRYDVGEKARGIEERLELIPLGTVAGDDPNMAVTDAAIGEGRLRLWFDYRTSAAQRRRLVMWKSGSLRSAQAWGRSPAGKFAALEDAARAALRAVLRGSERNRPREVRGAISLAAFPPFRNEKGQWAVPARFYVEIGAITPFAAY
ncbi:MAG: hypothetical protein LBQ44_00465 [Treponema sp.]|jgi:hypothetical protein|nr:hypothetical protein [Treponema sp.]